jgi:mRNA-degrading endonuclease RelE of RelBE toxin-antitoxin system
MLNLEITKTPIFEKQLKSLKKRFRNIDKDVDGWSGQVADVCDLGVLLGDGIYKVRISNSDKQRGKSGGYRVISYLKLVKNELILIYIYDKSDLGNIDEKELDRAILTTLED